MLSVQNSRSKGNSPTNLPGSRDCANAVNLENVSYIQNCDPCSKSICIFKLDSKGQDYIKILSSSSLGLLLDLREQEFAAETNPCVQKIYQY